MHSRSACSGHAGWAHPIQRQRHLIQGHEGGTGRLLAADDPAENASIHDRRGCRRRQGQVKPKGSESEDSSCILSAFVSSLSLRISSYLSLRMFGCRQFEGYPLTPSSAPPSPPAPRRPSARLVAMPSSIITISCLISLSLVARLSKDVYHPKLRAAPPRAKAPAARPNMISCLLSTSSSASSSPRWRRRVTSVSGTLRLITIVCTALHSRALSLGRSTI